MIIQSSLDAKDVQDEDAVQDTALAIRGEEAHSRSGGVGREWVAHAAEPDDGKHTRASQFKSAVNVGFCWILLFCLLLFSCICLQARI
jgi:hypothetical protein